MREWTSGLLFVNHESPTAVSTCLFKHTLGKIICHEQSLTCNHGGKQADTSFSFDFTPRGMPIFMRTPFYRQVVIEKLKRGEPHFIFDIFILFSTKKRKKQRERSSC